MEPKLALSDIPSLWRASALATAPVPTVSTGFAALDAELPGHGWPLGQLTEVLQPEGGWREWRLLVPALASLSAHGAVVLVAPPWVPYLPALSAQGVRVSAVRWVRAESPLERVWAAEQALGCAGVAALLAWLPQCSALALRRLHAAAQRVRQDDFPGSPLLWVMRPWGVSRQSSPAPLRVGLLPGVGASGDAADAGGSLSLRVFKRRGPVLERPIRLNAPWPALGRVLEPASLSAPRVPEANDVVDCPSTFAATPVASAPDARAAA